MSTDSAVNAADGDSFAAEAGRQSDSAEPSEVPEFIPARMLNEFIYCPRLFYLEWVSVLWADNPDTAAGRFTHRVVDRGGGTAPEPGDDDLTEARAVAISSDRLGLTAVIDLIEGEDGKVRPLDYKRGSVPDIAFQAWDTDRAQLCVAGLLLREEGYDCDEGVIYYAQSRRRIYVEFNEELISETLDALEELRVVAARSEAPPPLVDSPKCPRCSLVGICLPDEVNLLSGRSSHTARRLLPRDLQSRPFYVTEQGAWIKKKGGRLEVKAGDEIVKSLRLIDVSQLCLFGNVQISSQAVRELLTRDIPVCWFNFGGRFIGMATGLSSKHVELRRRQVVAAYQGDVRIAAAIVGAKIANSRTILRRNAKESVEKRVMDSLKSLASKAAASESIPELLGIEGAAARDYFLSLPMMLSGPNTLPGRDFSFQGRNRRPPRDAVNCLLSFLYSLLTKELTATTFAIGFDPYLGFFHRPRFGRPALALDLAEEFRPLIADSTVLTLINNGEVKPGHFTVRAGGVSLTSEGRKRALRGYERRLEVEIAHPEFGYRITYRRVLEVQARLLAAVLLGEIPEYRPFVTR
jgi:CRISPR-associated protein Cas1